MTREEGRHPLLLCVMCVRACRACAREECYHGSLGEELKHLVHRPLIIGFRVSQLFLTVPCSHEVRVTTCTAFALAAASAITISNKRSRARAFLHFFQHMRLKVQNLHAMQQPKSGTQLRGVSKRLARATRLALWHLLQALHLRECLLPSKVVVDPTGARTPCATQPPRSRPATTRTHKAAAEICRLFPSRERFAADQVGSPSVHGQPARVVLHPDATRFLVF